MIQFLKSLSPKTRILLALILGGIVIFLFWATLFGFLSARRGMERVNQYNIAIGLARQTNADFQLAISKGKNFAILKDETNKGRSLDYFKKAKESFSQLSGLEQDPAGKELLYRLGAALKSVEFSLGILTSTAHKNDPPEKLYTKYLKDITIDFDNASQAYVDFLEGKILTAQWKTASETQMDLLYALAGALLALVGMGLSYSIAYSLNQALRNETASQERYRMLSEVAEEAIMIQDQGVIVEANSTLARLLGYSMSEIIGKHVSLFMDRASAQMAQERIKKGYPESGYEVQARRKDGTTFPLLVHGRDIEYQGRKMRLSCGWDLSEWKKTEKALKESQERFERFAEVTKEGIMIHEKGIIVDVNQALLEMTGLSTSDLIGTDGMVALQGESAEKVRGFQRSGFPTDPYEIILRRKDGTLIPTEVHGLPFTFEGRELRVARFWDLTERKRSEKALEQKERYFRAMIEKSYEAFALIGPDGLVRYASPAMKGIYGWSPEERVGRHSAELIHPDDLGQAMTFSETILGKPGGTETIQLRFRHKDGNYLTVEVRATNLVQDPDVNGVVVNYRDITERQKMEQAVKESEERFKSFAEITKEGIFIHDDGVVVDANESLSKMTGYPISEIIGNKDFLFHKPTAKELIAKYKVEGYPQDPYEVIIRRKDGSLFPAEVEGRDFQWKGKKLRVVTLWDITERKKAEDALRQSEENFRNLIEKSPDAILVNQDNHIIYSNSKLLTLLGYDEKDELLGQAAALIVHPDDQKTVAERIKTLSQGGRTSPVEIRLLRRDGAELPVESASINIQFQGRSAIMVNLRDITARKQAEATARENQERYRSLVEAMPDAVMVHDEEKILFVNPSGMRLFGARNPEELLNSPFWTVVPSEFEKVVRERIRGTMERGIFNEPAERKLLKLDGAPLDVLVTSVPFNDRGRRVVLAIFSDISARKEAERKAQKYQRLAALGELAAGLAHEIRNPAAAISAQAQYILKKTEKNNPSYEQLKDIIAQCDRLDTLVHDTLDYSPEKKYEERTEIPAKDLLQKTLWLAQTQFGPSHARVQVILDVQPDLPLLRVHPTRMERVLVNLILNAFQAMPEGGHLLLRANQSGNRAILRVEDDGKGFTEEQRARLFEPFFTSRKMGSGLGLAICQKIVEEHKGQIKVERVEPHGAAFAIEIPLEKERS